MPQPLRTSIGSGPKASKQVQYAPIAVMTVASGFSINYRAGIKHIRYDLEDRKNENIGAHFDTAAAQIDRRTFTLIQTSKRAGFWCIAALASPE